MIANSIHYRVAGVTIPVPTDSNTQLVTFGTPIPSVVFLSGNRVSWVEGSDKVTLAFTFDTDVYAWEVRLNSTGPHDGNRVAGWVSQDRSTARGGTVEILAKDLMVGDNEVVVYGRTLFGLWSPHPLNG